ncbi:serine/threonine-protein kinase [Streptomyces sp. LN325]|uniref:serine/threonine-protein kinase n=1 Tax=Streptomyces sp. LN325 TaxID=3112976 RepID=UPI003710F77C
MGRVWRAVDDVLGRQVAVKEMRIDGLDPEDTRTRRERTLREARATARIDHPNVVRIYDVVDEDERLWIVMELVAGRSLEQVVVEDGPLDPSTAARIGLGLVSALRQVHAGGVLHRDIKPGNVLVETRGGRVVLTDFGIAALQDAEALTMVGMLVGSPDYMAPERISGRPQGPPSDVWSLGATLCAALGGRSPFSRSTTLATLHAVLYEEPELPSVEGGLRDVLAALLEKDPSTRPGLEELGSALWPIAFPAPEPAQEGPRAPETAPLVLPVHQESPTPVFLDPQLIREARRRPQRPQPEPQPEPETEAEPEPETEAEPEEAGERGREQQREPDQDQEPDEECAPVPGPAHRPDANAGSALEPDPVPDPAPDPERGSEPDSDSHSAPEPDPVQDAIPALYTPTRKYPPDPGEPPAEEQATAAPETRAHVTQPPATTAPVPAAEEPEPPEPPVPTLTVPSTPTSNASTEAPTELHSQVRSEIPSAPSAPATPSALSSPSSLASHTTTHGPAPVLMPPGELPGPVVPSVPGDRRRRTALVAAGGVVVAGVVAGIVIAANGGSSHDTGGTTASASASPSATSARTPSGEPSSPLPTVDGTSRPPSLPAGAREEAGLYAWVPPQDWQRVAQSGSEVHYTSPDSAQEIVANATPAKGDLLAQWQQAEGDTSKGLDYRRIRLERTTFRGEPAVAWEYTVMAKGRLWHVRLLGFRSGGTSYEISTWYHPDIEAAALRVYDEVRQSFTPL